MPLPLCDVFFAFAFFFRSRRKARRKPLAKAYEQIILAGRRQLCEWLARLVDEYILGPYSQTHDVTKNAPSLRAGRKGKRVSNETAWDLMEQARASSSSVAQVILIRKADGHVGCGASMGDIWASKVHKMYEVCAARQLTLSVRLLHVSRHGQEPHRSLVLGLRYSSFVLKSVFFSISFVVCHTSSPVA